jgi:hypothetical protein
VKFNITTDPRYAKVVEARNSVVWRSSKAGLGRTVKKSDMITPAEEAQMLASDACRLDTPRGVNNRFVYYYTRNMFIRAGKELRNIDESMFSVDRDNEGASIFCKYFLPSSCNCNFSIN